MLEVIALLVYSSRLVALARSRGRSPWWALGGVAAWAPGAVIGWRLSPADSLLAAAVGLLLSGLAAWAWYRLVYRLSARESSPIAAWGDNFCCPCCSSLQTEDRSGHLRCHACGVGLGGWPRPEPAG